MGGHSFKLAVSHSFLRDSRDCAVLPERGTLWYFSQELSAVDGIPFLKTEAETQFCRRLGQHFVRVLNGI
jgi:hypothetical protein